MPAVDGPGNIEAVRMESLSFANERKWVSNCAG